MMLRIPIDDDSSAKQKKSFHRDPEAAMQSGCKYTRRSLKTKEAASDYAAASKDLSFK